MDVAKIRHLTEVGLSGIDVTDTEDALEIAALCLSEILKNVADDPIAIQIISRIEARFGGERGIGHVEAAE